MSHRGPSMGSDESSMPLGAGGGAGGGYVIGWPEMAREITRRWISDVPSKMV
jgi:hypothetical protein